MGFVLLFSRSFWAPNYIIIQNLSHFRQYLHWFRIILVLHDYWWVPLVVCMSVMSPKEIELGIELSLQWNLVGRQVSCFCFSV